MTRPWITNAIRTEFGDWEYEITYPDGKVSWITVPEEVAGAVDLIAMAEVSERQPPPALRLGRRQPTG